MSLNYLYPLSSKLVMIFNVVIVVFVGLVIVVINVVVFFLNHEKCHHRVDLFLCFRADNLSYEIMVHDVLGLYAERLTNVNCTRLTL